MLDYLRELFEDLFGHTALRVDARYDSEGDRIQIKERGLWRFFVKDEERKRLKSIAEEYARESPNTDIRVRLTDYDGIGCTSVEYH
ncbi:hypothetical protein DRN73_04640 [Candidatus Pacearchaeota archaeon]|nr:MAG: hypothetical protein DRN73_04640 [Candidatus Pacearchaeota archaeon]